MQMGDWRFFWPESVSAYAGLPQAWDSTLNTGIGKSAISTLWINSYLNFTSLFSKVGLSWNLINLLFWFIPPIVLSFFSAYLLFNYLFKNNYKFLAGFIYLFNTYFLIILSGGQLGVALSYSLAPLVILFFIRGFGHRKIDRSILAGLVFSIQIIFDPRIALLTLIPVLLFWIINFDSKKIIQKIVLDFIIPFFTAVLINFYWILPLLFSKSSPVHSGYDSLTNLKFFSFAFFENSISLLQPNWPENIFGKVYFMRPEFLILPILAYLSLLFIEREKQNFSILFFALLGIVGAFLAKGTNPPFGEIYTFLFKYLPGFVMFRDPTKWYLLIAISYSVLIPFSVWKIVERFKAGKQNILAFLFLIIFLIYFIFLIKPIFGLGSLYKEQIPPKEYFLFKEFLISDKTYFRTLWIPKTQRYAYFSDIHPQIQGTDIFKEASPEGMIKELKGSNTEKLLSDLAIKYVIVPYDSNEEIFLFDRKYSEKEYKNTLDSLRNVEWLSEKKNFGKILLFKVPDPKGHFFIFPNKKQEFKKISNYEYEVNLKNTNKGNILVFSEGYDSNWSIQYDNQKINSSPYRNLINSFILIRNGNYTAKIYYEPQKYVNIGLVISAFSLLFSVIILIFRKEK